MEVVQQKVMFLKLLTPRDLETAPPPRAHRESCGAIPLPTSPPTPFPTSRSSEMISNTSPFTVGHSQATASNHKVVVDCHSQIPVRVPSFAAAFPALI